MRILSFGDIFAKPGRRAVAGCLPDLKEKYQPDFVVGNVENLAGGRGVNQKTVDEMNRLGFHGYTSGNHIWDNREIYDLLQEHNTLAVPANYPNYDGSRPGQDYVLLESNGHRLALLNLLGRVYMDAVDCPFGTADKVLAKVPPDTAIYVDMHAETTSEKAAMSWYLDGKVSAVVGTHTHVQTADERILPKGTAFISDIGMSGCLNSSIGMEFEGVIEKFRTKRPRGYKVATGDLVACCVVIDIGDDLRAKAIERIRLYAADPN